MFHSELSSPLISVPRITTMFFTCYIVSNLNQFLVSYKDFILLIYFLFIYLHRENAAADKVKEAHRKVMVANHPDAGGSHYLASKINEAKDVMLGKTKGSGSPF